MSYASLSRTRMTCVSGHRPSLRDTISVVEVKELTPRSELMTTVMESIIHLSSQKRQTPSVGQRLTPMTMKATIGALTPVPKTSGAHTNVL